MLLVVCYSELALVITVLEVNLKADLRAAGISQLLRTKGIDSASGSHFVFLCINETHVPFIVMPVDSFDNVIVVDIVDMYLIKHQLNPEAISRVYGSLPLRH